MPNNNIIKRGTDLVIQNGYDKGISIATSYTSVKELKLSESTDIKQNIPIRGVDETDFIKYKITKIISNNDLFKKALIASGIYDSNLKLTPRYK